MEKNPKIADGTYSTEKHRKKRQIFWKELSEALNAKGPPLRDSESWKKVRELFNFISFVYTFF